MRLLLLIRALDVGGAETQTSLLAAGLEQMGHDVVVATLYPGGALEEPLRRTGVPILSLEKRGRYDFAGVATRLVHAVRRNGVEVVYSTLTAANILAATTRVFFPKTRVIWSLRASNMDLRRYDRWTRGTSAVEPWLARWIDRIVVNSDAGWKHAAASGFPRDKMIVVRNAIDAERFRPDSTDRDRVRSEWGIAPGESLVGLVGRIDPMKDHLNFLTACKHVAKNYPGVRFVCVGSGPDEYVGSVHKIARELALEDKLIWAGPRVDMPAVYAALDLLVQSSSTEGLPNVVAEAMACETPCVATDVGDTAWVVGDCAIVVPPGSPSQLAAGIEKTLRHPPSAMERRAMRERVIEKLGCDRLIRETEAVFRSALEAR